MLEKKRKDQLIGELQKEEHYKNSGQSIPENKKILAKFFGLPSAMQN